MKLMIKKLFMLLVPAMFFLAACEYEYIEYPKIVPPPPGEDTTSFATEVLPIFSKSNDGNKACNAAGCHNTGGIKPDLSPANAFSALTTGNYINTANPASSKIYTKCAPGGSMNKYMAADDLAILLKWIQYGAPNN